MTEDVIDDQVERRKVLLHLICCHKSLDRDLERGIAWFKVPSWSLKSGDLLITFSREEVAAELERMALEREDYSAAAKYRDFQ